MQDIINTIAGAASAALLGAIVAAILVLIVGKIVLKAIEKNVDKLKVDKTLTRFLLAAAKVVIVFVAFMIVAGSLGFEMSSLVALASVVSAAFALAASGVLSNLFGGILLLISKPFGVDDYVSIGGQDGTVLEISMLATKLNTVDNKRIVIPNSAVASSTVVNFSTEGKRRVDLVFNVAYENAPETVKASIRAAAEKVGTVVDKESIFVRTSAYNESTVSYTLRAWCLTADYWDTYFDLIEGVRAQFDADGVKFSYPHLTVAVENK